MSECNQIWSDTYDDGSDNSLYATTISSPGTRWDPIENPTI